MLSAICKDLDFDFDDADEDEYDPVLGNNNNTFSVFKFNYVYDLNKGYIRVDIMTYFFHFNSQADKKQWQRGEYRAIPSESARPINKTALEYTRRKRLAELEMW